MEITEKEKIPEKEERYFYLRCGRLAMVGAVIFLIWGLIFSDETTLIILLSLFIAAFGIFMEFLEREDMRTDSGML